jgi:hypothetical protein
MCSIQCMSFVAAKIYAYAYAWIPKSSVQSIMGLIVTQEFSTVPQV